MPDWWRLPGPSVFVQTVAEDLRGGRNVVICLPQFVPSGLKRAVRHTLPESDGWNWESLEATGPEADRPVEYLFSRFLVSSPAKDRRDVWSLAQEPSFWRFLLWLDNMQEARWPAWRKFLRDYEEVSRQRPLHERSTFCVILVGQVAMEPPPEDVCLSVRRWEGCVDGLDMLLYTSEIFRSHQLSPPRRRLAATIAASLALWDPEVGDRLAGVPFERLLNPRPLLVEMARERNWRDDALQPLWHRGMVDRIEGRDQVHSACLALSDSTRELESRLWKAEVSIVLPELEEQRRDVLSRYSRFLQLPFTTQRGDVIKDLFDLELSHIAAQLGNFRSGLDSKTKRQLNQMAMVRNKLAHLELLGPEDVEILD